jgi:hypothetical protein
MQVTGFIKPVSKEHSFVVESKMNRKPAASSGRGEYPGKRKAARKKVPEKRSRADHPD